MNLTELFPSYVLEDGNFEAKLVLEREQPLSWLKTVDGFANANGGTLVLGVEDDGKTVVGFDLEKLSVEKDFFLKSVREHFKVVPMVDIKPFPYEIRGKTRYLLTIEVQPSLSKPVILSHNGLGLIFLRRDGYTSPATAEEIRRMALSSPALAFDRQITDEVYNPNDFRDFFAFFQKLNEGRIPNEKGLRSIPFFDDEGKLFKGASLFSDSFSGGETKVVCTQYPGKNRGSREVIATEEYEGGLIGAYRFIDSFVRARENHGFIKLDSGRKDVDSYPNRALFEAIINALAHRDYLLSGEQIAVDMFVDRLVISTPGNFFEVGDLPVTYEIRDLLSRKRNELICAVFVYAHAMEARGSGFELIQEEYAEQDYAHRPCVYSHSNQFTIVLPDITYPSGVDIVNESIEVLGEIENETERDVPILAFCLGKPKSSREIANHLKISDSSFLRKQLLSRLEGQGYLLKNTKGRVTFYHSNPAKVKLR